MALFPALRKNPRSHLARFGSGRSPVHTRRIALTTVVPPSRWSPAATLRPPPLSNTRQPAYLPATRRVDLVVMAVPGLVCPATTPRSTRVRIEVTHRLEDPHAAEVRVDAPTLPGDVGG